MITRPALTLALMLTGALALVAASVHWVDLPLARYLTRFHLGHELFTRRVVTLPVLSGLAALGLALGGGFLLAGRRPPRWAEAAMLAGLAVLVGQLLVHEVLKPLFGRDLPEYYLRTGRYGFHLFHGTAAGSGFPSGHSTEAAAMLWVAQAYYPRARWALGALMAALAVALMVGEWHFLGDVLAGTALGVGVAAAILQVWRRL